MLSNYREPPDLKLRNFYPPARKRILRAALLDPLLSTRDQEGECAAHCSCLVSFKQSMAFARMAKGAGAPLTRWGEKERPASQQAG